MHQKLFNKFVLSICFVFGNLLLFAQTDQYAKVRVMCSTEAEEHKLHELGLGIDHVHGKANTGLEFFVNHDDLWKLESSALSFEILIPDFEAFYNERQKQDQAKLPLVKKKLKTAVNFDYGTMGGFYTLGEIEAELDNMRTLFPTLASAKINIGTSIEGRPIWAIRISDNPDVDEAEPAVYYDALHHAREPASMATMMNYMYWLLENYNTDPQVKYIIDERESYFVPVVNPDGYEYNRTTNPNGGGFWRKNRRNNPGTSCVGVDLNRNYSYLFALNNSCASTSACQDDYRGASAFSEPETQAIRDFVEAIEPSTSLTVHSYAGNYILPDVDAGLALEFDKYSEWATDFTDSNEYLYGTGLEMLGYIACGTTDSYLHSEGVYTWTPEMGTTGFWPPQSQIFALVDQHLDGYFYQAWIAGAYADVKSSRVIGDALAGGSFQVQLDVKNKGLNQTATNVTAEIVPSDASIITSGPSSLGSIPAQTYVNNNSNPISISIPAAFAGDDFTMDLVVYQDGVETTRETISICIGVRNILLDESAEAGTTNWTNSGSGKLWLACEDDAYNGDACFCDSEGGNSLDNSSKRFTLNQTIDLTGTTKPHLEFLAKWSIEDFYDEAILEISINGGGSWTTLRNYMENRAWNFQSFDLTPYQSSPNVTFRFTMDTDGGLPGDGFYFDDFKVVDYTPGVGGGLCDDLMLNGDETGIDCGGSLCPPCPCNGDIRVINTINADENSKYSNYVESNISGSTILNNAKSYISAANYIELHPNFEIILGTDVHLYIDDCIND